MAPPGMDDSPPPSPPTRVRDIVAGIVAIAGLLTLLGIVGLAVFKLPGTDKGPNIVAISSAAFGVIGSIVGAYFGIRAAGKGVDRVSGIR
jgi:hypothetical protein